MTDFLALDDLEQDQVERLIARAQELKQLWQARRMPQTLEARRIALVVDDYGWRNTTAFDLGIQAMGGLCVHAPVRFSGVESVADLARYLDNWVDATVARTTSLASLREFAGAARAPVVNARTRDNHPCETLGDLSFVFSQRRTLQGLKVVVLAPQSNILRSWIEASAVLPIEVRQVYPATWHVPDSPRPRFSASADLNAVHDADVVITDCWPAGDHAAALLPYQVTSKLLERLSPQALFVPCPPVTHGQELSDDALSNPRCRVFEAKDHLLHAQNALLEWLLR